MRIAHIVDSLEVGGKEMFVVSMCRLQREKGHSPAVHCLVKAGPLGERLREEGFAVQVHGPGGRLGTMQRLASALRRERPDVAHCHNVQATVFGAPAARWAGVKMVITTRHNLVSPPYQWRRELQYALAGRLFCRQSITVCESARKNLSRLPFARPDRISTVYNGAAAPRVERLETPRPVKSGYTFVQVSRLTPPKDLATLLEAFRRASAEMPELRLWIVGDGTLAADARRKSGEMGLAETVTFFGQRGDVPSFLQLADCFVLSSRSEGVPIAQLEAMAMGLPMIVSRVGGMPEVLPPGDGFVSTPAGDAGAMAEAMLRMARSADQREVWAEMARRQYQERFTLERMAAEYLAVYQAGTFNAALETERAEAVETRGRNAGPQSSN